MTIRIFNPEHDIALASNMERFTAPHAGRQLRSDLCYLPALWSNDGDVVIVDDIDFAESACGDGILLYAFSCSLRVCLNIVFQARRLCRK